MGHVAVVVQVVLGEVGEDRQPDVRARHTVFGQPNGRSLYRTGAITRIHKTAQGMLPGHRVWGG